MTRLSQPCHNLGSRLLFYNNLGTTLYFETVARLWQGGGKVVTRLSQGYTNIVTRLPQCTLSQPWHNLETVARLLLWEFSKTPFVLEEWSAWLARKHTKNTHLELYDEFDNLVTVAYFHSFLKSEEVRTFSSECTFFGFQMNMCNLVTKLRWGGDKVCGGCCEQGCDKDVTSLWQTWHWGHKVVVSL